MVVARCFLSINSDNLLSSCKRNSEFSNQSKKSHLKQVYKPPILRYGEFGLRVEKMEKGDKGEKREKGT